MKLWGAVWGAVIGWMATPDFPPIGLVFGAMLGFLAGLWLQSAIRDTIQKSVRDGLAGFGDEMRTAVAKRVEERLGGAPPPAAAKAKAELAPAKRSKPVAPPTPAAAPPPAPAPEEPREPSLPEQWFAAARDWLFGGNTIVRVGLVILFVGLSFLARFVASRGLFPIEVRLSLVAAAGAALLVVGFNRRVKRPQFGRALQGAGVAVLYLTVFAAARVFELMPPLAAFGLMIVISALGVALALLQDSKTMALASFAGGFAVPVLLGGESETPLALFTYFTILNLAILFIAWRRSWRSLNLLGFAATFGLATVWGLTTYEPQHYLLCQLFLAGSVLIYLATALLYAHNTPGKLGNAADATLLFGPAVAGFGLQAGLVREIEYASAFAALGFGAVYVGAAAYALRERRGEMRLLAECLIAIAVGFITLAVPLALEVEWTSAAWALEGAGAFWVGMRQARWMPRAFGLALIAVAGLIVLTTLEANVAWYPLANTAFVGAALIAAPLLVLAWWLRGGGLAHSGSRLAQVWARIEAALAKPLFLAGFGFACIAITQEVTRSVPTAVEYLSDPVISYGLQPLALIFALLGAIFVAQWFGLRRDWDVATWPARASLPVLGFGLLGAALDGHHVLDWPDAALWGGSLALHAAMLRHEPRRDGWTVFEHAGTIWLLAAMLADSLDLGIDRAALWNTSWAGVSFLVAVTLALLGLNRWAGRAAPNDAKGVGWPLAPHHRAYWWVAALPLAALTYLGALATAAFAQGVTDPLPYVPLLNPVDLSVALALVALLLWRRTLASAHPQPAGAAPLTGSPALVAAAFLAFVLVNTIWLRTAHHWLGIDWNPDAMGASSAVQTGLAIIWTLLAMALMLLAARKAQRVVWLTGAGLLVLVVAKLLLIDMSSVESWQRIVTFIAVGVLMLVIGYFVPLPPRKGEEEGKA